MASPIFLNGREPPFMASDELDLNEEKIKHAVDCMTYPALQVCAIGYLLFMKASRFTPKQICDELNEVLQAYPSKKPDVVSMSEVNVR